MKSRKDAFVDVILSLVVLVVITLLITPIFIASANEHNSENLNYTSTDSEKGEIISGKGKYFLFRTADVEEYLNFLEKFDDSEFEIIDISTSYHVHRKGSDEFYMITYRAK